MQKTSTFSNSLIWFGAAVSIAEILTGVLVAPLGFTKGLLSIVLGHIIGCILLYLAGIIGGDTGKSAMQTVKISFGEKGTFLFSFLNVVQLVGWTSVMIVSGSGIANAVVPLANPHIWSILIGLLIIIWLLLDFKRLEKVNTFAMGMLFILTILLAVKIFSASEINGAVNAVSGMSFGSAVELSVAMPLSWLPLISDYTRNAENPKNATIVSVLTYFFGSCFMYVIGMGLVLFTGHGDLATMLTESGLGIFALIIVLFSTVTTTFLDVYSAGASLEAINLKFKEKPSSIICCILGVLIATASNITAYESFLYFISSVFAPMIAILIADYFILKTDSSKKSVNIANIITWVIGFIIYRLFMSVDTPVGYTLPVMLIIMIITIAAEKIKQLVLKKEDAYSK